MHGADVRTHTHKYILIAAAAAIVDAVLRYAMLCCAMLCCAARLGYAMICCAMLCCAMLCYVMICDATLCYDVAVPSLLPSRLPLLLLLPGTQGAQLGEQRGTGGTEQGGLHCPVPLSQASQNPSGQSLRRKLRICVYIYKCMYRCKTRT
eukprot:5168409-Pyramimonas_sp.AAC.1